MLGANSTRRSFVRSIGAGGALLAATGVASAHGRPRDSRNFRTHLSSKNVVTHDSESKGQGQAVFQLNKDGDALGYKLNVANLENIIGAHIHHAPAGQHGPIVIPLFGDPFVKTPVTVDGTLAQGTITSSDLQQASEKYSSSGDFETFLSRIRKDEMFVLVHTTENVPGAIRGQIR